MNVNVTQCIKVLLVNVSDMLNLSNFVRHFHHQSFALHGTAHTHTRTHTHTHTFTNTHTHTHTSHAHNIHLKGVKAVYSTYIIII